LKSLNIELPLKGNLSFPGEIKNSSKKFITPLKKKHTLFVVFVVCLL
jgi:hypothetical protein